MRVSFLSVVAAITLSTCLACPAVGAPAALVMAPVQATPPTKTQNPSVIDAQTRLDQARQSYQQAVTALAHSLGLDLRAVEANGQDLSAILPNFNDEEVRLRQRFGDGDRVGTWGAIRQASLAWRAGSTPSQRPLAAARARSDAVLFSVMVALGDAGATNGELIALWDEAVSLDPRSFQAYIGVARAAFALGDTARAAKAAQLALVAAHSPADTAEATILRNRASAAS